MVFIEIVIQDRSSCERQYVQMEPPYNPKFAVGPFFSPSLNAVQTVNFWKILNIKQFCHGVEFFLFSKSLSICE